MNKICNTLKQSVYTKWIIKQRTNLFISISISIFLTILTYPGILYSDSYGRIAMSENVKTSIYAFLHGEIENYPTGSWLTVTPSFFIMLSKAIVGSIVLYTFIQSLSFLFFTYVYNDQLNENKHPVWNKLCLLLSPVIWAFSIYYEASVGCVTAILAMLLLIWKWRVLQSVFDKVITIILLIFSSFVCFGYRANAFSIIPVIFIIVLLREKKIFSRLAIMVSVFLGFIGTFLVPAILNINTMSSYSAGFAWEIVSTIQSMDTEKQEEYKNYLDDIFGEGSTKAAIHVSIYDEQEATINPMFESPINPVNISAEGNSAKLIKKYVKLAVNEPKAFLKMKWEFISHTLGIEKPINLFEYNYNRGEQMDEYGFNDSPQRERFVNLFHAFMEFMVIFRRPWILYLVSLILILIWRFKFCCKNSPINLYEASFGVALFYYGAYILNTQSFEFRYFFPSWLLLFSIIIGLSSQLLLNKKRTRIIAALVFVVVFIIPFIGGLVKYKIIF